MDKALAITREKLHMWQYAGLPLTAQVVQWARRLPEYKWIWICKEATDGRYASPQEALADADNVLSPLRVGGRYVYLDKDTTRTEDGGGEYGKVTVTRCVSSDGVGRVGTLCRSLLTGRIYHAEVWSYGDSAWIASDAVASWRQQDADGPPCRVVCAGIPE